MITMKTQNAVCIVIVLLSLVYESSCIYCFYCNSANNSACLDLNQYEPEERTRLVPIVNCDTAIPGPFAVNFFCRKIVQKIFHTHRDAEIRVTRGCGWVRHHKECYRADNQDHLETVCQCFENHCNSSDTVDASAATILFLVLSGCLYFLR